MSAHLQFDEAIERYTIANNTQAPFDRTMFTMRVNSVIDAGRELLRGYGALDATDNDLLTEAALWALQHFERLDASNAAIHCAPVRYSPVTFRLAAALREAGAVDECVARVTEHQDAYPLDPGR